MSPRIAKARHLNSYCLELTFTNGAVHELDFARRVLGRGGVFRALEDIAFFERVQIDPEAGTIVWPNGVDFCPGVLYALATDKAVESLEPA
jgi:hypothetical protein